MLSYVLVAYHPGFCKPILQICKQTVRARPRNPRFKDAHAGTKRRLNAKTINRGFRGLVRAQEDGHTLNCVATRRTTAQHAAPHEHAERVRTLDDDLCALLKQQADSGATRARNPRFWMHHFGQKTGFRARNAGMNEIKSGIPCSGCDAAHAGAAPRRCLGVCQAARVGAAGGRCSGACGGGCGRVREGAGGDALVSDRKS
jgi:hypothetical protein